MIDLFRIIKLCYLRLKRLSKRSINISLLIMIIILSFMIIHVIHMIYFLSNDNNTIHNYSNIYHHDYIVMNNITGCMNTKQGKTKVCDSNGIVCNYDQLDEKKECCKYNNNNKYACNNDCDNNNGCCKEYEICVSCCMHPDHKNYHLSILNKNSQSIITRLSGTKSIKSSSSSSSSSFILNHLQTLINNNKYFEYCSYICRTNSASTQSENSYRSYKSHCYYYNSKPLLDLLPVNNDWKGYIPQN